jgi:hypothetical protein
MSLRVFDTAVLALFHLERKALHVLTTVVHLISVGHDRLGRAQAEL